MTGLGSRGVQGQAAQNALGSPSLDLRTLSAECWPWLIRGLDLLAVSAGDW